MYESTAFAIAKPSNVDVPLPSSSIMIKECLSALVIIFLVSSNSKKNVLLSSRILSVAPILVKILLTKDNWHDYAGT